MEFLLRGASQYKEPGVFISFEESPKDLAQNFASMGYDLNDMIARKLIAMDHIYIDKKRNRGDRRIRPRRSFHPPGLCHRFDQGETDRSGYH